MPRGIPKDKEVVFPNDKGVTVSWKERQGWRAWGDRFHFLSPEGQHAMTGRMKLLPPLGHKKRKE